MSIDYDVYEGMKALRDDFNCVDPSLFLLPTMNEMFGDDILEDRLKDKDKENGGEGDANKAAFYSKGPFSTELGYHKDKRAFVLRIKAVDVPNYKYTLNQVDGDTTSFKLDDIDDGGGSFEIDGTFYNGFKDYCKKNGVTSEITIRSAFINCPEIPHVEVQAIPKGAKYINTTYKEAKKLANSSKNEVYMLKCNTTKDKTIASKREDNEKVTLYQYRTKSDVNSGVEMETNIYYEVVTDKFPYTGTITSDMKNSAFDYKTIVVTDDSTLETIIGGYKAQKIMKEQLQKAVDYGDLYLVVDASMITGSTTTEYGYTFNNWLYAKQAVGRLIKDWKTSLADIPVNKLTYQPYGMDMYGRFLGTLYVKNHTDGSWTNISKLILASDTDTINNPNYSGSSELESLGGNISDALEGWTYDKNSYIYADLNQKLKQSYNKKIELHREITGIDFEKNKDCTVMLGDTLFIVPPTSIRNASSVSYEKKNILRGKGSMNKEANREQLLELELYFYGESGINGIKYDATLPNNNTITYYMNGLRSLIAQFKVAPFLPIENGYINDILCIEAVTLESMDIENVEGYQGLIRVILTLREFNYRVYMPDIPSDTESGVESTDEDKEDNSQLAIFKNPFSAVFDWEIFRYHYQKAIIKGETASNLTYGETGYIDIIYDNKNVLQKADMCSSNLSFYVPDNDWLEKALEVKKDRDKNKTSLIDTPTLDEAGEKYIKSLATMKNTLDKFNNAESTDASVKEYKIALKNVLSKGLMKRPGNSLNKEINKTNKTHTTYDTNTAVYKYSETTEPIIRPILNELYKSYCVEYISVDEKTDDSKIEYSLNINLDTSMLSKDQKNAVESVINGSGSENNGILTIKYYFTIDGAGKVIVGGSGLDGGNTNTFILDSNSDYETLSNIFSNYNKNEDSGSIDENQDISMSESYQDFRNPKAMQFVPYLEDIIVSNYKVILSNTFTQMYLKSLDGYAPQYMGAQDTSIEIQFITNDTVAVSLLNNLASFSVSTVKKYRRILPSWPLRVKNSILQMIGINEVIIEQSDVKTIDSTPGLYDITLRLTSIDRTMREREALSKVDQGITTSNNEYRIRQYFDMEKMLSKVDIYPDLDIPTLSELSDAGFEFAKYYLNNDNDRAYPDPDFYILYSHLYTAALIKKIVKDTLSNALFSEKAPANAAMRVVEDTLGIKMKTYLDEEYNDTTKQKGLYRKFINNDYLADEMDNALKELSNALAKADVNIKNKTSASAKDGKSSSERFQEHMNNERLLTYLTACDVQKGWTIKNTWIAPRCEKATNDAIKEYYDSNGDYFEDKYDEETSEEKKKKDKEYRNAYAKRIIDKRKKAIRLIDNILAMPMQKLNDENKNDIWKACIRATNDLFNSDYGKELMQILCPIGHQSRKMSEMLQQGESVFASETLLDDVKNELIVRYTAGFLYASACARSAENTYSKSSKVEDGKTATWFPRQKTKDKDGKDIPFAIISSELDSGRIARSERAAEYYGRALGAFGIRNYTKAELLEMFKYDAIAKLFTDDSHAAMYPRSSGSPIYRSGFADRYYNGVGWKSEKGHELRKRILKSPYVGAMTFLRVMLMHLRKLILEGVFFSEIDIIAEDFDEFTKENPEGNDITKDPNFDTIIKSGISPSDAYRIMTNMNGQMKEEDKLTDEMYKQIIEELPNAYTKSFASRLIYPFLSAATDGDKSVLEYIKGEDTASLDAITANPLTGQLKTSGFDKFMAACEGIGMFSSVKKADSNPTSLSQKVINFMSKNIQIAASNDPRIYIMHSYYDMLVNDKRGRLVRAFPTYYMMLIDEGREIGIWRLFDNFYSMSAISDLTITKSRKNPTDVCTFSMNNMFDSFSDTYSDATTQQYTDLYELKDVWTSIFSPREYLEKEDLMRRRFVLPDTTVLKPGVRIHIRIGYGGDASKLSIGFNGKIAELSVGDVVEVIAQGDGHELTNPLNVLGEVNATSLLEAQQTVTLLKGIRGSFHRGGLSPKSLLTAILCAKYGGIKNSAIRSLSDGQFFNDNPFGISHFGDHRFKNIHEDGEPVQNIYEVVYENSNSEDATFLGMFESLGVNNNEGQTPTINTSIHDKTAWELLEMCANSGNDYYGAIRDFGLRSTVFLGRPNDYIAFQYKIVDDKIVEKRKPFQQFHYYNSYTDIVYNTITASESTMKTNATGTWMKTDPIWGKSQATVGPIYLDMNIYPEYQKSMTVDTGLISAGNGGIDINPITWLSENTTTSIADDKVNKSLAEQITTNCLKNSVKDMYTGELCVLGDPSISVYDRVSIDDTYEDMTGSFEVESLVFSMNSETGFTTTIVPDVIVKTYGTREMEKQEYEKVFFSTMAISVTSLLAMNLLINNTNIKMVKAVARNSLIYKTSKNVRNAVGKINDFTGLSKYITPDADGNIPSKALKEVVDKIQDATIFTDRGTQLLRGIHDIDTISTLLSKDELTVKELTALIDSISTLDVEGYKQQLNESLKNAKPKDQESIEKLIKELDKIEDTSFDFDSIDTNNLVKALNEHLKDLDDDERDAFKNIINLVENMDEAPGKSQRNSLYKILKDPHIDEFIKGSDILTDEISNICKTENIIKGFSEGAVDLIKNANKFKLSSKVVDSLMPFFISINPATILFELGKEIIFAAGISTMKANFTRWFKNIQALIVYPIQKNMLPLRAGMNGSKGSIMSYPPADSHNSIQGMTIDVLEKMESFPFGGLLRDMFIISDDNYEAIVNGYKQTLGITGGGEFPDETTKNNNIIYELQNQIAAELGLNSYKANATMMKARLQSFNTNKGTTPEYVKYSIRGVTKENISRNEKILELVPIEDDAEIKKAVNGNHKNIKLLEIAHSKSDKKVQIDFEEGSKTILYTQGPGSTVFDMPLLQEDALFVLKDIISHTYLQRKVVHFTSGVRINSTKTWQNTGFRFVLKSDDHGSLLKAVKASKDSTMIMNQYLFNYDDSGDAISICVYPPIESNKKESE